MKIIVLLFAFGLFFFNLLQAMQQQAVISAIIYNAGRCGITIEGLNGVTHMCKVLKEALQEEKLYDPKLKKEEMLFAFFTDMTIKFKSVSEVASDKREEKLKELIKIFARKQQQNNNVQNSQENDVMNTTVNTKQQNIGELSLYGNDIFIQNPMKFNV